MSKIIGLDLGSYNSCVSVYEGSEVKIIPNSEGSSTTPSIVAFTKDGEIKVGEPAKRQAAVNPENTIYNIKRLIGKTYEQVKDIKRPYKIVDNKGRAAVKVTFNGSEKIFTPEEISAYIIQKMVKTAEDYLGESVKKVIITVPAHFNTEERDATKIAGEIAGLEVLRVIAEPTAAALNVDKASTKKYGVFDFGGSTFDMSVVDIGDGVYEVISTDGDLNLGGSNIDQALIDHVSDTFLKTDGIDLRKDTIALQRLVEACEKAKIELSSSTSTDINLPYITVVDNIPKHLNVNITKSKFEELAEPFVDRTIELCKTSIAKAKMKLTDLDDIILVGGSTRIPLVQSKLEKLFGKAPNKSMNPDTCVSTGATIQGGVMSGDVSGVLLLDVLPLTLGIETMGGVFTKMIESNTTIPYKKSETFSTASDNQPSVQINIAQGERAMFADNKSLGTFHLDGIMPAPRGVPQIEVTFDVDMNGILKVTAKDKATNKESSIRIEGSSSLTKDEIERMKRDAEANVEADRKRKEDIETINTGESLVFNTNKNISQFKDNLSEVDINSLNELTTSLQDAVNNKDIDKIKDFTNQLNEKWNAISTEMYAKSNAENNPQSGDSTTEQPAQDVDFEEVK